MDQTGGGDQTPGLETQDFDANQRRSKDGPNWNRRSAHSRWLHPTVRAVGVVEQSFQSKCLVQTVCGSHPRWARQ